MGRRRRDRRWVSFDRALPSPPDKFFRLLGTDIHECAVFFRIREASPHALVMRAMLCTNHVVSALWLPVRGIAPVICMTVALENIFFSGSVSAYACALHSVCMSSDYFCMSHLIDFGPSYAVTSLPSFGEGHASTDHRPRGLLNHVKRLLLEVGKMPLFGVESEEFHSKLQALTEADAAATEAAQHRQLLLSQFVQWTAAHRGRVLASYLEDLLAAFYN